MRQLLNTLYVMTPNAYVRLENDTLRVEVEHEKKLQVPLHHLGAVVVFGDVLVSPAVICRCAEDGRSLVFLDRNGAFKARVEGPVSGNILLRQAQFLAAQDVAKTFDMARAIIAGKLRNSRQVLLRGARDAHDAADKSSLGTAADRLAASLRSADVATDIDELRGVEGEAARSYFEALTAVMKSDVRSDFAMNGRSRRPPRDRINALLSFAYALVMNDCRAAVEGVGLDAQLGFLHAMRPGRAALALDLMEEFRAVLGDRLVLTLINRGQITKKDFVDRPGGAVYLADDARKTVVVAYQERKQEEVTHPLLETKAPIGLLPHLQARLIARTLRGDMEGYVPFLYK